MTDRGMAAIETRFDPQARAYTGRELRSHFAFDAFGIAGDSAVAFVGPCRVDPPELVDLADARAGAFIASPEMLHVIVEHFGLALEPAILLQRLLARLAADLLRESGAAAVTVRGNDVFVGSRKASVSVATCSPVSALIHYGLNVRTEGAPVPAWGLSEAGIAAETFARELLGRYARELDDIRLARSKVRGVP